MLVTDALRFDVRRAGFDPAAAGIERTDLDAFFTDWLEADEIPALP